MAPLKSNNNEDRNAENIEHLRNYVLQRIDQLQTMVSNGVTKEQLERELERVHDDIDQIRDDVKVRVGNVRGDLEGLGTRLDEVEEAILAKQKESYKRIIAVQATILISVITSLISVAVSFVFHH